MTKLPSLLLAAALAVAPSVWAQPLQQNKAGQNANAQTANEQAKPPAAAQPYPSDKNLVNIDVMVTDDQGHILGGLKPGNFRILDNRQPREIQYFAPPKAPITVVLLMEYSSHTYQYYAGKSAYWGERFLDQLQPEDWVALVTYDLQPKVQVDFTHNNYAVRDAIAGLGFPMFRDMNLFDALIETVERLDTVRGRKAIVVIGTGLNSFSGSTFDDVRRELRSSDVMVFCVGTAEQEFVRSTGSSSGYLMAKNQLESFAKQTGGIAYFPRFEGALPEVFSSIAAFLRHAYTVGFVVPADSRDGRYHRLKLEIVDQDGKPLRVKDKKGKWHKIEVMAREGYTAPKPQSSTSTGKSGGR